MAVIEKTKDHRCGEDVRKQKHFFTDRAVEANADPWRGSVESSQKIKTQQMEAPSDAVKPLMGPFPKGSIS